jgi:TctA family transporter
LRPRHALIMSSFVVAVSPQRSWSQTSMLTMRERIAPTSVAIRDTVVTHRRATLIGATAGVVLGGGGAAAYILNALAPNCLTQVSASSTTPTLSSSHCGDRSRIVVLQTATIAAGATAGGFAGAWVARRVAGWRDRRHHE